MHAVAVFALASADSMITDDVEPVAELVEQLRARDAGQVDVEQHDVPRRLATLEPVRDRHAVGRGLDLDVLALEPARHHRADRVDHRAIVVDDEDLDRIPRSCDRSLHVSCGRAAE